MRIASSPAAALPSGLLLVLLTSAAHADSALPSIEEYVVRTAVITLCHPEPDEDDNAYFDLAEEVGRAAFASMWTELNIANPRDLEANGMKADRQLQRRLLRAGDDAQKQIEEKGCAEMERITAPMHASKP